MTWDKGDYIARLHNDRPLVVWKILRKETVRKKGRVVNWLVCRVIYYNDWYDRKITHPLEINNEHIMKLTNVEKIDIEQLMVKLL
jgi:hypothetical protein